MSKTINSYWGVELKPYVTKQGSKTLAVVLPGIGYTLDRVTLEYSGELALNLGYDLVRIEYGFQVTRKPFNVPEEFDIIVKESLEQLKNVLEDGDYENIVIIGKSIGTAVQTELNKSVKDYNVTNIYISPIDKTAGLGILEDSLVITGTKDPLLSKENVEKIKDIKGVQLISIKDADHPLNIEKNPIESLKIQLEIIEAMKKFLNR